MIDLPDLDNLPQNLGDLRYLARQLQNDIDSASYPEEKLNLQNKVEFINLINAQMTLNILSNILQQRTDDLIRTNY